ncbi:1-(5-phosphoribosyl)-5-[(5-phosphoribosylamino)methylideneamino]imidazole-4-carboxamide isomerase [Pseudanabaena galeata UHCC 0370]|jgi:phosphoribosylformimino-5-aminoimidazole carboxamide ribotide isomerase|uniref:1-(5-phosphoribosyl)-5-[(5-phosphoribosylamino)methylideneamino] imidazole-4-carboxamide isomerase n=1 Tax=Pseudanabaena galeata UHCC 0370 TaxID=3110310 RepID=A0ABU5THY6_9CYAN|nr:MULTISPECIES: 1-(5-phosphoribosyl)-5-[(5-phosphoribosylamino)methylideneamino]imidazole-4-carboxamide isomerase [Pseudanabaena]MEA5477810.1 1-(5-phosphoribosyl)-5-[(5-phosphoribosylamino)methylideneamino]imidazole-4-carboxamide isomerase [Pseudanabaena galeata UHCC 0370]MEA5487899.1 1-(5-phosphoribosyl)-5-[(5-phosphoribosylamino)methylideneamino]imidazole-4-carboxamide isomerase [Pseudanabaena sp. CCNP1317]WGS72203.1 1-(5-phosphoribosyl)-5-[(5-phosphoribosylamino)methylideneamino]imidazole-4-
MDVIPAIDILDGRCVRLYQGDYQQSEVFGEDPVEVAQRWYSQGAKYLHVVDLDGAKEGKPKNLKVIEAIARSIPMRVQMGGGLRDRESIVSVLNSGVSRVILGTAAVERSQLIADICAEFPEQIMIGIDARDGKVATRGWLETSDIMAVDLAKRMTSVGIAGIIYTDIHRDGTMQGPNIEALRQLAENVDVPVIASGGVSSITDLLNLLSLESVGVSGAIVGKAIYTGDIQLKEAIRAVGNGRWQDVIDGSAIA